MTEHIYPAFERGRIMKKELLWALRDYSYTAMQNQYQEIKSKHYEKEHMSVFSGPSAEQIETIQILRHRKGFALL